MTTKAIETTETTKETTMKKPTIRKPMGYLAATAHLMQYENLYLWKIESCPICGDQHLHGAGPLSEDPRRYLSHRVEHCMAEPTAAQLVAAGGLNCSLSGYILTDEDPDRTDAVLAKSGNTMVRKGNQAAPVQRKKWGSKRVRERIAVARSNALKVAA